MDPLRELTKEAKQAGSKDTSFLAQHIDSLISSFKEEIISINKTSLDKERNEENIITETPLNTAGKELITIPTFLIPEIKEELRAHSKIVTSKLISLTKQAVKAFSIPVARSSKPKNNEKTGKIKRISKYRKSSKCVTIKEERLALKQDARAKLNLSELPNIGESSFVVSTTSSSLKKIRETLKTRYEDPFKNVVNSTMRRIKAVRIADSLEEAEYNTERQTNIKNMIASLKREDAKNAGVRIASR